MQMNNETGPEDLIQLFLSICIIARIHFLSDAIKYFLPRLLFVLFQRFPPKVKISRVSLPTCAQSGKTGTDAQHAKRSGIYLSQGTGICISQRTLGCFSLSERLNGPVMSLSRLRDLVRTCPAFFAGVVWGGRE